jgi:hydroxymethylglutaryl-CoA synthase
MSLYVPALRVRLEDWCAWTDNPWDKVRAVVGTGFRYPARHENVYTMAATAALRLIDSYGIDPRSIGFLALGTESSTDNAAGAVIVRGMLDRALEERGQPRLARDCEVPEYKHACLGGIYALKGALRYVRCDGQGKKAIVICGDIAEYERGSSGEQTQGAGAVAMLVDREATLFTVDLEESGSASDYRGPDFRKPFARHFDPGYASNVQRMHDFPVFSGKYSTYAYLDQTCHALDQLLERRACDALDLFEQVRAIFFHRPYRHMPIQAMAFLYLRGLARRDDVSPLLSDVCQRAGVCVEDVRAESRTQPDLFASVLDSAGASDPANPFPAMSAAASQLRKAPAFAELVEAKMSLGSPLAMELGNLYTAALPAWLAAGLEQAAREGASLQGEQLLAIGYGSGDAAEALTLRMSAGWREAALRIGVEHALADAVNLSRAQYEALHDGREVDDLVYQPRDRFLITHVGARHEASFQDLGVEYYAYAGDQALAQPSAE